MEEVEVTVDAVRFLKNNKALARLLLKLKEEEEMSTVQLLQALWSTHHGQSIIKDAETHHLIERHKKKKGRGRPLIMNKLTDSGRKLAALAESLR